MRDTGNIRQNKKVLEILNTPFRGSDLSIFELAWTIRCVENNFLELFKQGQLSGTVHTCVGQEFCAIAVCNNLNENDFVFSNHRGHGHYIAHTLDTYGLICELLTKRNGPSGGVGGSQHLLSRNFLSNGIQGSSVPVGVGVAYNFKEFSYKNIVVSFIGDGTLGQGVLYESLNIASLLNLPLLLVIEDNEISQSTPQEMNFSGDVQKRMNGFGLQYFSADTDDLATLMEVASSAVSYVRTKGKPGALHIKTSRLNAHSKGDDTRSKEILKYLWSKDVIRRAEVSGDFSDIIEEVNKKVSNLIYSAILEPSAEIDYLYKKGMNSDFELKDFTPYNSQNRFVQDISQTLSSLLEDDKNVVLIGEDILSPYGGAFKATADISSKFPEQVISTPISESAITGFSIGLALSGKKPILEIMFGDFITLTIDQILNNAVKFEKMFGRNLDLPLIIRTPMGAGGGYGPTHSQSLEKLLLSIDNLDVVALNRLISPYDIYTRSVNSKKATIIIENKTDYKKKCDFNPSGLYNVSITSEYYPSVVISPKGRPAKTAIFTYGHLIDTALNIQRELFQENEEFSKIVVVSCLSFINEGFLECMLSDCDKLITIESGDVTFGWGSEIIQAAARLSPTVRTFARLGAKGGIIPSGVEQEKKIQVSSEMLWDNLWLKK